MLAVGGEDGVGVAQGGGGGRFGGEGAGFAGVFFQQVEALVGEVGEDDAPAGECLVVAARYGQVGASSVFVDAGAGVPGGGQQVGDGAVGCAVHDGGAAVFVGAGFLPPGLVSDHGGEAQAVGAAGGVGCGDGGGPAAVGQDHTFGHGVLASRALGGEVKVNKTLVAGGGWWRRSGRGEEDEPRRPRGGRGSSCRTGAGQGVLSGTSGSPGAVCRADRRAELATGGEVRSRGFLLPWALRRSSQIARRLNEMLMAM
ncbi:hypothetical protein ABH917_002813 [Thermobifida halotolerans]